MGIGMKAVDIEFNKKGPTCEDWPAVSIFLQGTKMMANAMSKRADFDAWWMLSGLKGLSRDHCHKCLRPYRRDGWLMRHYRKTGHWEE